MTNLSRYLAASANSRPDASALVSGMTTTSYSMLRNEAARVADYLTDGGLRPGDHVGVMLPNGPDFAAIFYGVLHAGGVVLPLNPQMHSRPLDFFLTITDARLLFVPPQHAIEETVAAVTAGVQPVEIGRHGIAHLTAGFTGRAEPMSRADGDTAVVLPIANTIGAHTVQLTHGELTDNQSMTASDLLGFGESDVVMGCLPLTERVGLTYGLLATVSTASTLVFSGVDPAFDPGSTLEEIEEESITVFEGTPPMYLALMDAAHRSGGDFSSLRVCVLANGSLPEDVLHQFEDRFGCVVVHADELLAASSPVAHRKTDLM
jgi:long-chain acyl-CoA synthetase